MNKLRNRSRRNNIRVDGLIEADKETLKGSALIFQDVIKENSGITINIVIDRANKAGDKAKAKDKNRHQTIVARLYNYKDKDTLLNQTGIVRLSTMGRYRSEHFSEIIRQRRYLIDNTRKLMRIKEKIQKHTIGIVFAKNKNIIIGCIYKHAKSCSDNFNSN